MDFLMLNLNTLTNMNKIVINNISIPFDLGVRLLKLKYENCPKQFDILKDQWDTIVPLTFSEICQEFNNIEERRVAFDCLGLDRLENEVNPLLVNSETLTKTTTWINLEGVEEVKTYKDTYELYYVKGEKLFEGIKNIFQTDKKYYYVKFKDTSTDRYYLIWVNILTTSAIESIAWTFTTKIPLGNVKQIVRQGDCVLVYPIDPTKVQRYDRHLTEYEYRNLLILES